MKRIKTNVTVSAGDHHFVAGRVVVVGTRHHPGNDLVPAEVPVDLADAWLATGQASPVVESVAKTTPNAKPKAKARK